MRFSKLFSKTLKEAPSDEVSKNARLLEQAGFVYKNSSGIYTFLPLGWKVVEKIIKIVREEINNIGGQEVFMPAMIEKKYMEPTARWDLDVGFKVDEENFVLGWTHEEVITAIAAKYISSYKDLPLSAYQIQTKFRNEPRAKSGLLRGREFLMKDLYSFHSSEKDLSEYYNKAKEAYFKIFNRCGLKTFYTLASGGHFTDKFTHEFQVLSEIGEDAILLCRSCEYAENSEISDLKEGDKCPKCEGAVMRVKSIEVGNIFNQGTMYSDNLGLYFTDESGVKNSVWMAAYGIGISRLMATIVEVYNDNLGIIWPQIVAPFDVHLISLDDNSETDTQTERLTVKGESEKLYAEMLKRGKDVLYDDRSDKSAGEKLADADLIGIPLRLIISNKTLKEKSVEIKKRNEKDPELISLTKTIDLL